MRDLGINFGVLIAFVLPGFVALWAISTTFPPVGAWFARTDANAVMLVILASLSLGVFLSAVRWVLFDKGLMEAMGEKRPKVKFGVVLYDSQASQALATSIEQTYRYYQFYSNIAVAIVAACLLRVIAERPSLRDAITVGVFASVVVVTSIFGAREALRNYYADLREISAVTKNGGTDAERTRR